MDYQCTPSVGQPLVNALLQSDECTTFAATSYVDSCATNANGQTCTEVMGASLEVDPLLSSLETNCAGSVDTCNPSCKSAITSIADSYGCCVNAVYNNSETGEQFSSLSYSLWNSCGVDSPGFCSSSLTTLPQILPPNQGPSPTRHNGSRVLAPVNWIFAWASLLLLKQLF